MNRQQRRAQARGKQRQPCRLEFRREQRTCPNCAFHGRGGIYRWRCGDCGRHGVNCLACCPPELRELMEEVQADDDARMALLTAKIRELLGDDWTCADGLPPEVRSALPEEGRAALGV